MLELLDTDRMAFKFGKWRGMFHLAYALAVFLLSFVIANFHAVLPGPSSGTVLQWMSYGLIALGSFLWCYGVYRLYRDHVHMDFYLEADGYNRK